MFLGFGLCANEYLIGTAKGVIRARSNKRFLGDECWDNGLISCTKGTPLRPLPSRAGIRPPTHISEEGEVEGVEEVDSVLIGQEIDAVEVSQSEEQRESMKRTFHVTSEDICKYGFHDDKQWNGCKSIKTGYLKAHAHSGELRSRAIEHMPACMVLLRQWEKTSPEKATPGYNAC